MSTKRIIAEMVLYKLYGGPPPTKAPVKYQDVYAALEHKVNTTFKMQHFSTTLASGETIPDGLAIATYENITVTSLGNGKAKSLLPVIPVSLIRNMGIFLVYSPDFPDNPFIPLMRGQTSLLKSDLLLNDLMGQVGYEPKNLEIIYTTDITSFGVDNVTMELIVFDMSRYNETDMLPIPSDYESQIEDELVQEFAPVLAKTGIVNPWSPINQNAPTK